MGSFIHYFLETLNDQNTLQTWVFPPLPVGPPALCWIFTHSQFDILLFLDSTWAALTRADLVSITPVWHDARKTLEISQTDTRNTLSMLHMCHICHVLTENVTKMPPYPHTPAKMVKEKNTRFIYFYACMGPIQIQIHDTDTYSERWQVYFMLLIWCHRGINNQCQYFARRQLRNRQRCQISKSCKEKTRGRETCVQSDLSTCMLKLKPVQSSPEAWTCLAETLCFHAFLNWTFLIWTAG